MRSLPALLVVLLPTLALARAGGITTTQCTGCHGSGQNITTIQVNPPTFNPGATVTLTVTISGGGSNGGLYLQANYGLFTLIAGQNTRLFNNEVLHNAPKSAAGGKVTFDVQWTAPTTPGAVDFDVYTVMGNGNGSNSGDAAGFAQKSVLYGCAGITYYRDLDRDGVGAVASGTALNCAVPAGYAVLGTDCDDANPLVKPGAIEACNGLDDNCNSQVDEGLTSTTTWPDVDKDGYGAANGTPMTGCVGSGNRAPNNLDCNDMDPALHPGATEICNFRDDDCDGQYDEGVYARCGVGWCQRTGTSCDSASCTPAAPLVERCNKIDDDCNGLIDDGNICPSGQVCMLGECIGGMSMPDAGPPDSGVMTVDAGPVDSGMLDSGMTMPGVDSGMMMRDVDAGTVDPMPSRSCAVAPGLFPLAALLLLVRRRRLQ